MKKLFFVLSLLCCLCAHSQQRMFEEGKSWIVNDHYFANSGHVINTYEFKVAGDTLINDTLAIKLSVEYLNSNREPYSIEHYPTYVYEEGSKVYLYYNGELGSDESGPHYNKGFLLLYDSDWQVGDYYRSECEVDSLFNMTIEGIGRKVISLGYQSYFDDVYLIDGIGTTNWFDHLCIMYPIPVIGTFLGTELVSCHKDGVCLFSRDRFYDQIQGTDGIADAMESTSDASVYDLSGRRVSTLVKGQIYIRRGKKTVW